ncbi:MAG: hypothetical protein ABJP34_10645 [Erythrobacter sp.]
MKSKNVKYGVIPTPTSFFPFLAYVMELKIPVRIVTFPMNKPDLALEMARMTAEGMKR